MSAERRRSSAQAWDHQPGQSPMGSQRRKLSFNPVGERVPPIAHEEPIAAFEISKTKRVAQVVVAVLYCLFAAGIIFGFAALKPVLIAEGVYRDRCTSEELGSNVFVCHEQELRLNLMFTTAAVSTNVAALPIGTILDRYGPRITSIIGVVFLTLGALFFAFAQDLSPYMDGYIPAYLFLALGGPFAFISAFQLSNTFPRHSGLILALLTGAFDTSSAVFLLYRLLYEATDGAFKLKTFFLIYLIVPALILLSQIVLMPRDSYKTVGEAIKQAENPDNDVHASDSRIESSMEREQIQAARREQREAVVNETTSLLDAAKADSEDDTKIKTNTKSRDDVWGALHSLPASKQILTPWFALILVFTMLQMTRINYFVATIRTQYSALLSSQQAAIEVNSFFDVALPLGGVIAVPFIGLVLDHTSTVFALSLLVAAATAIGALGLIPSSMAAAYANVVLFVLYRPLYYTAISDYSAKVFGFDTFGTVYGLIMCLAGIFNFSATGLDALTHGVFRNDPGPVNVALLIVTGLVGIALVAYVWMRSRHLQRQKLEEDAEGAEETRIPDSAGGGIEADQER